MFQDNGCSSKASCWRLLGLRIIVGVLTFIFFGEINGTNGKETFLGISQMYLVLIQQNEASERILAGYLLPKALRV